MGAAVQLGPDFSPKHVQRRLQAPKFSPTWAPNRGTWAVTKLHSNSTNFVSFLAVSYCPAWARSNRTAPARPDQDCQQATGGGNVAKRFRYLTDFRRRCLAIANDKIS